MRLLARFLVLEFNECNSSRLALVIKWHSEVDNLTAFREVLLKCIFGCGKGQASNEDLEFFVPLALTFAILSILALTFAILATGISRLPDSEPPATILRFVEFQCLLNGLHVCVLNERNSASIAFVIERHRETNDLTTLSKILLDE